MRKDNEGVGEFHWEYSKNGEYWAHRFYETAEEAHEAYKKHQEQQELWKNSDKVSGKLVYVSGE